MTVPETNYEMSTEDPGTIHDLELRSIVSPLAAAVLSQELEPIISRFKHERYAPQKSVHTNVHESPKLTLLSKDLPDIIDMYEIEHGPFLSDTDKSLFKDYAEQHPDLEVESDDLAPFISAFKSSQETEHSNEARPDEFSPSMLEQIGKRSLVYGWQTPAPALHTAPRSRPLINRPSSEGQVTHNMLDSAMHHSSSRLTGPPRTGVDLSSSSTLQQGPMHHTSDDSDVERASSSALRREADLHEQILIASEYNIALAKRLKDSEATMQNLIKDNQVDINSLESQIEDLKRDLGLRKKDLSIARSSEKSLKETLSGAGDDLVHTQEALKAEQEQNRILRVDIRTKTNRLAELEELVRSEDDNFRQLRLQFDELDLCHAELMRQDFETSKQMAQLRLKLAEAQQSTSTVETDESRQIFENEIKLLHEELEASKAREQALSLSIQSHSCLQATVEEALGQDSAPASDNSQIPDITAESVDPKGQCHLGVLHRESNKGYSLDKIYFSRVLASLGMYTFLLWMLAGLFIRWTGELLNYQNILLYPEESPMRYPFHGTDLLPRWLDALWYRTNVRRGLFDIRS